MNNYRKWQLSLRLHCAKIFTVHTNVRERKTLPPETISHSATGEHIRTIKKSYREDRTLQQEKVKEDNPQQDIVETGYYVIRKQAVPDVLLKVVEAKKLLESGKVKTVNEAAERLGISRSSFYKYKEDIYEFHDSLQGTTLTLTFQMNDEVGLLSYVLNLIAEFGANILTIHQSIPLNGVASISITIQVLPTTRDIMEMISLMEKTDGVHKVHITGRSATLT